MFDAHDRAFAFFRGTCTRGIYDSEADEKTVRRIVFPPNETAVETIFVGKERAYNRRLPHRWRGITSSSRRSDPLGRIALLASALHAGFGLGEGAGREGRASGTSRLACGSGPSTS